MWRCINRLDYGKKYCHNSPSVEESVLQSAIMNAIMDTAMEKQDIMKILKLHIGMVINKNNAIDNSLDIQMRIAGMLSARPCASLRFLKCLPKAPCTIPK
ncbi:MAG: hypothetical protein ACI4XI_01015 [Ruminococcus sp.]